MDGVHQAVEFAEKLCVLDHVRRHDHVDDQPPHNLLGSHTGSSLRQWWELRTKSEDRERERERERER